MLLFLTGPLQYLPTCVLGVLVFLVALKLIDLKGLRDIRAESPQEFALAVMTAAVVLLVGVEAGDRAGDGGVAAARGAAWLSPA